MNNLFYNCSSLSYLPDISKWNKDKDKNKNINMSDMFGNCSLLLNIPKN